MMGEMSMPPNTGTKRRDEAHWRLGNLPEKLADHADELVACIHHVEMHQPGQDDRGDQQENIDIQGLDDDENQWFEDDHEAFRLLAPLWREFGATLMAESQGNKRIWCPLGCGSA